MADVRFSTLGYAGRDYSRTPGTKVGVRLNLYGMSKLQAGVTGQALSVILLEAAQPCLDQALGEWPVDTGASRDSIELAVVGVEERKARVALQAGGEKLIDDPRNKKHIDYAPFIEFNGSPAGRGQATLLNAVLDNHQIVRDAIHDRVGALIRELIR
jgi:hypothetical protein